MGLSQKLWVNFLGFQFFWWCCMLLQNSAISLCAVLLFLHLYFHDLPLQELKSITCLGIMGFSVDFLLTYLNVFHFSVSSSYFPPLWLLFLWVGFATNITTLSNQFQLNKRVFVFVAAVLAPLSYLAAAKLNVVTLPLGYLTTWLVLTPVWLVLFPALLCFQNQIAGDRNAK